MIHITKASGGYQNVNIGKNGKVLSTSEIFTTKDKCFKNSQALLKECFISLADYLHPGVLIQDDTTSSEIVYFMRAKGNAEKWDQSEKEPRYVRGKNPSKKKK